jgi:thiamine kinase-like enzyme
MESQARRVLSRIPHLAAGAANARLTLLHGLTNLVYKVETPAGAFVLRMPAATAGDLIDRSAEAANARAAARLGVAPEVVHAEPKGAMLTRYVDGIAMSPAAFRGRDGAIDRAAEALSRLHGSGVAFANEFRLFEAIDRYLAALAASGHEVPPKADELRREIGRIRAALESWPVAPAPCHCDPTGLNIIDTGAKALLIDWEFSGMADPAFDLAYLSVEAAFDAGQDARLLAAYADGRRDTALLARFALHKPVVDYLSALWDLVQRSRGARFSADAAKRLARCRAALAAPDLLAALDGMAGAG